MQKRINDALLRIRARKPVILCLTNFVTMDFVANALLALGASPVMIADEREVSDILRISSALYINIGTLSPGFIDLCELAIGQADIPIVLDPVGSGASLIRTDTMRGFLAKADIVRGNADEILSLVCDDMLTKGVDSSAESYVAAKSVARALSLQSRFTVGISGSVDYITDGEREYEVDLGSPLMPLVTGMGCSLTAAITAFRAVEIDSFEATRMAMTYWAQCGSMCSATAPGSFKSEFLDKLYENSISNGGMGHGV